MMFSKVHHGAIAVLLMVGLVACTSDSASVGPGKAPTSAVLRGPVVAPPERVTRGETPVIGLAERGHGAIPGVSGLPRSLPDPGATLPSVLDSPPGRAVMSFRHVEHLEGGGWASEQQLLYSRSQGWQRLNLAELNLPESSWPGEDMYGVGRLSPDGKFLALPTNEGLGILDLRTGDRRLLRRDWNVRHISWYPDSRHAVVGTQVGRYGYPKFVLDIRTGTSEPIAYDPRAGVVPDGSAVVIERIGPNEAVMKTWEFGAKEPVIEPVPFDTLLGTRGVFFLYGDKLVAITQSNRPPTELFVADADTLSGVARLRAPIMESLGTFGWIRDGTLLVKTRTAIWAWQPRAGRLRQLFEVPNVPRPIVYASWDAHYALGAL